VKSGVRPIYGFLLILLLVFVFALFMLKDIAKDDFVRYAFGMETILPLKN